MAMIPYQRFPVQGQWEITVQAPVRQVWAVLDNSANLPKWCGFFVKQTDGGPEQLNATRHCYLDMDGQQSEVWERTIDYEKERRIYWVMERDTGGLIGKILRTFVFGFQLIEQSNGTTKIVFTQYYNPANLFTRLLLVTVMKPKMGKTNQRLLQSLKSYVEQQA